MNLISLAILILRQAEQRADMTCTSYTALNGEAYP